VLAADVGSGGAEGMAQKSLSKVRARCRPILRPLSVRLILTFWFLFTRALLGLRDHERCQIAQDVAAQFRRA